MSGLLDVLNQLDGKAIERRAQHTTRTQVARALNRSQITLDDLPHLLSPAADDFLGMMAEKSHQTTLARFGRTINLFSPLYFSNYCGNKCTYCGYSAEHKIKRRRLSLDEIETEADVLYQQGFRNLLIVTGEDPSYITPEFLKAAGERLKPKFPMLSMETQPFDTPKQYRACVEGGIDGLLVYQETYDREVYDAIHVRGKKKRFENRITAPERGAEAGMRRLGLGVLLGIAPVISDCVALATHALYLQKHCWKSLITMSFPRMQPFGVDFTVEYPVGDRQFLKTISAFRLLFPDNPLILSTREKAELRDALIPCGITTMSAGSSTEPGGYTDANVSGTQFDISDERSVEAVVGAIANAGYEPVWKDWE